MSDNVDFVICQLSGKLDWVFASSSCLHYWDHLIIARRNIYEGAQGVWRETGKGEILASGTGKRRKILPGTGNEPPGETEREVGKAERSGNGKRKRRNNQRRAMKTWIGRLEIDRRSKISER